MGEQLYRVIIEGVTPGNSTQKVIENLSRLFKTDPIKFQPLAKGDKITVNKKADRKKADLYKTALEKIGCTVSVLPEVEQSKISSIQSQVTPKTNIDQKVSNSSSNTVRTSKQNKKECAFVTANKFFHSIRVPQICTCCMKPTNNKHTITKSSRSTSYGTVSKTIKTTSRSWTFFTCKECVDHNNKLYRNGWFIFWGSVFLGTIFQTLVFVNFEKYFPNNPGIFLPLCCLLMASLISILITGVIFILPSLSSEHSSYTVGVQPTFSGFKFYNVDYARLFQMTNKGFTHPSLGTNHFLSEDAKLTIKKTFLGICFNGDIYNFGARTRYIPADILNTIAMLFLVFIFNVFGAILINIVAPQGFLDTFLTYDSASYVFQ